MSENTTDTQPNRPVYGSQNIVAPPPLEAPRKLKERRNTADERRRAVRACDQCRRVKEKCEGGVPCRRCLHFRRACEFKSITSRANELNLIPGRLSASNTSLREQRNRILHDRACYMEQILKHEVKGISLDTESLRIRAEAIPEEPDRDEGSEGPMNSSCEELAIDDETCTIDPVEGDTAAHFSGEFSYWNFSMRIKRQLEEMVQSPGEEIQHTDSNSNYVRAKQLQSGPNDLSAVVSRFPPRSIADFLIRVFFDFAETHYFYVTKSWLLEKLNIIYDNPAILAFKDAATISIMLTVFAIGTQYAYLGSSTQHRRAHMGSKYSEDEIGTMFYLQAIRLLPEIIESSTLESVQACLLFGVYALPVDASGLAYIYINLALRLGMQNGMHRKYTGDGLSRVMIETRNRVWWTTSVLERKICIFHGRPPSMLRSDIDADLPKDCKDMQKVELPSDVAHMRASIHLTHKLEDYFNLMNLSRNYQEQRIPNLSARLLTIQTELAAWWSSLAVLQEKDDQHSHQARYRSTMHLRLEYCLIRMFVGRPFLFGHQSAQSNSNSPSSAIDSQTPTPANNEKRVSLRQNLVEDCIQAAMEAIEILRSLRDGRCGLARGSYIEYSSCRASLLVLIADNVQSHSDQYQTIIEGGLVIIRDMSAAGDSARSEVALIEELERNLKARVVGNESASGSLGSEYDLFKHWEMTLKSGKASHLAEENVWPRAAVELTVEPVASPAWGSFTATSDPVDHSTQGWTTSILPQNDSDNFFAMPSSDASLAFHAINDMALFEGGDLRLGSNRNMLTTLGADEYMTNTGHNSELGRDPKM